LKRHPEIIVLRKEDEPEDIMQRLGYEEILIRWLNYHIKKNGGDKFVKNLGKDLVDGNAYGHVLQNVAPSFNKSYWELNSEKRSVEVLEVCKK
jgi:plastin-1